VSARLSAIPDLSQGDWRDGMVNAARAAASRVSVRERAKNPAIPHNFLDVSEAGFPADIIVKAVQIPRAGDPAEMAQYRDMLDREWLHVPWNAISTNAGLDGKAFVAGAYKVDLGGGVFVAALAGHYLMFADRHQYEQRRAHIRQQANESRAYKLNNEQETDHGVRKSRHDGSAPMTVEELLEFERRIGDEPPVRGDHIGS